ncbi:hypothetical protein H5410_036281 [Solanum commersonii]|uniref:Uncharacterized protein n=1 Tax=Solanum commersonii TaxID=4109 RepID=A0A9J5Y3R3_SOLCO|nr:hypothetical protein H5410_036281 [Solanum commersonii]
MLVNKWYTPSNKVVESTISPLEEITLPIEGKVITTSPFKMDIIDRKDIKDKPSSSYKDKNKNSETHPILKLPEFSTDKFPNFQEKLEIMDENIEIN